MAPDPCSCNVAVHREAACNIQLIGRGEAASLKVRMGQSWLRNANFSHDDVGLHISGTCRTAWVTASEEASAKADFQLHSFPRGGSMCKEEWPQKLSICQTTSECMLCGETNINGLGLRDAG